METRASSLIRPSVFDDLPGIVAAFTTREGGVSEGPYASMNLGLSTDDDDEKIWKNRWTFTEALGFTPEQMAMAGQVHGDDILNVSEPGLFSGYDGLVTDRRNLLLGITAADCATVMLADPEACVLGACHSGWRGTVARISQKTIAAMTKLGAAASNLHAWVSPCISEQHFEVGSEVAEQFDAEYVMQSQNGRNPHVDLKAAIRDQLLDAGVPSAQVEVDPQCTFGNTDLFYSHRAEDGTTGRMMGVIGMKSDT